MADEEQNETTEVEAVAEAEEFLADLAPAA